MFKQIISSLLLFIFCVFITPKEVIHAFANHTDTEHSHTHLHHQLEISSAHHHCELMKADQQFASFDIEIPYYSFEQSCTFFVKNTSSFNTSTLKEKKYSHKQLRAPPLV